MSVEMKDSGIAWIGEIPKHWEVKRIKNEAVLNPSLGSHSLEDYDLVSFMPMEFLRNGIIKHNVGRYSDVCKYTPFQEEDIVLAKVTPCFENGNIAIARGLTNRIGFGSSEIFVVRCKNSANNDFVYYYLQTPYVVNLGISSMTGTGGLKRVNPNVLQCMVLVCPPKEEQSLIANFLDKKCAEIDDLIALQEQMIDQLTTYKQAVITETVTKGLDPNVKMKDSGVEWIGEIPEHWDVKRIKNVCSCFGRIGFRGYTNDDMVQEGEGAITLSPSNMKNMTMDYSKCSYLSWNKYYESPEIQIQVGDVLLVKTGSTFGKSSYVHEIPMECTINPQIICFKDHKESAKFLNYLLNTPMAKGQVDTTVVGGTIPTIAQSKIINYSFAFPPLSEQQSIATYLDQKCKEIDELISVKKEKIEKLKAYKKSVIYEYVTGKKQVSLFK